jgi:hypothetical protein
VLCIQFKVNQKYLTRLLKCAMLTSIGQALWAPQGGQDELKTWNESAVPTTSQYATVYESGQISGYKGEFWAGKILYLWFAKCRRTPWLNEYR